MEQQKSIFRKESLERISSPEQVDDYIRIASPGIWFVLAAVLLLLLGFIAWGFSGHLETRISAEGVSAGGIVEVSLPKDRADSLTAGSAAYAGGQKGSVVQIAESGDKLRVTVEIPGLPDGPASVSLVTESIAPITFLM